MEKLDIFMEFLPHSGAVLFVKRPIVWQNIRANSPTIALLKPKGWGNTLIGALEHV